MTHFQKGYEGGGDWLLRLLKLLIGIAFLCCFALGIIGYAKHISDRPWGEGPGAGDSATDLANGILTFAIGGIGFLLVGKNWRAKN